MRVGDSITPNITLLEAIGQGGMGRVFRARHRVLGCDVAVKILSRSVEELDSTALVRFQREARAAARLDSRHVVRVLDAGATPSGTPYLVMELLKGESLGSRLARLGSLPPSEVLGIVEQAASALGVAHAAGIVHRDISCGNLFLTRGADGEPCLKVLDFGVAKLVGDESSATRTGGSVGTPRYMSPEQTMGLLVDHRADVWGLAVVAYEALCGVPPFAGASAGAVAVEITRGEFVRPSELVCGLPGCLEIGSDSRAALDGVMERAFARELDARFPAAKDLVDALRGAFAFAGIRASAAEDWGKPPSAAPSEGAASTHVGPGTLPTAEHGGPLPAPPPTSVSGGSIAIDAPRGARDREPRASKVVSTRSLLGWGAVGAAALALAFLAGGRPAVSEPGASSEAARSSSSPAPRLDADEDSAASRGEASSAAFGVPVDAVPMSSSTAKETGGDATLPSSLARRVSPSRRGVAPSSSPSSESGEAPESWTARSSASSPALEAPSAAASAAAPAPQGSARRGAGVVIDGVVDYGF